MSQPREPLVVLLHGLARTERSMSRLAAALERGGLATWACTYPSRRATIGEAARYVTEQLLAHASGRPLFAVTHSMGGIVLRHMQHDGLDWRRIVMLAPPNQGSLLAQRFAASPLFRWFYGPAGVELSSAQSWPRPKAPFLVIAGTRQRAFSNPTSWTAARVVPPRAPSDGTVLVEETKLEGMAAFETVDATHTWIMNDERAQQLALRFLGGADG